MGRLPGEQPGLDPGEKAGTWACDPVGGAAAGPLLPRDGLPWTCAAGVSLRLSARVRSGCHAPELHHGVS